VAAVPLKNTAATLKTQAVTPYRGTIVTDSTGKLVVSVGGNIIPATFLDGVTVAAGQTVKVDLIQRAQGQSEAFVVGGVAANYRPGRANVKTVPPSSSTITVTGTDGVDYAADYLSSYAPVVGDLVGLLWKGGSPTVLGKVGVLTAGAAPTQIVAPPPTVSTGTGKFAASDTSTYWAPGGWDSWAGGNNVFQGDIGQGPVTGAWFYAGSAAQLKGATITAIRFTLGQRNGAGQSGSPVTVNLFTHLNASRPGGNVTIGGASTTVTAQPYQGDTVYNLPLSFATDLLNGGGIAIQNNPYAGFYGRNTRPMSGYIELDWRK
jgi:hypothetical protein